MRKIADRRLAGGRRLGARHVSRMFVGVAAGLGTLLAGCLSPAPYLRPDVKVPTAWRVYGHTDRQSDGAPALDAKSSRTEQPGSQDDEASGAWYRAFGDPALARLVDEVLAVNSRLAQAAVRIHQARLRADVAASNARPSGSATIGANGSRAPAIPSTPVLQANYSLSLSYELDVWGKLAAQRDAARWRALATEAAHDTIRTTLISDTADRYWQIGYLHQELVRNESDIVSAQRTLAVVHGQQAAGAAHGLDVVNAEQAVADVQALRLDLQQQLTQQRNDLAILLDRPPQDGAREPTHLPDGPLPAVPDTIPAELLSRRPDLRAAELELRALLANVDEARAQLYPTFSLTGSAGRSSATLLGLLSSPVTSVGLSMAQPLFDWHKRQLNVGVSQDEYEARAASFKETWYRALADVDTALSKRWQLVQQARLQAMSLDQARRAEKLARARFETGLSDVRPWLEEQRRLRSIQSARAKNQLEQLSNLVTLYKALGGDTTAVALRQGERDLLTQ